MTLTVCLVEDYGRMSDTGAEILISYLKQATVQDGRIIDVLWPAGKSPKGLNKRFVLRQGEFNSEYINLYSIDERILVSPENGRSFSQQIREELCDHIHPGFKTTNFIDLSDLDHSTLEKALSDKPKGLQVYGFGHLGTGKAYVINKECQEECLAYVRDKKIMPYLGNARHFDLAVASTGALGHVGLHEAGIPIGIPMFLVGLDNTTIVNSVEDGDFPSYETASKYGLALGAMTVFSRSDNFLALISGQRKSLPITKSLLEQPSIYWPLSYSQEYIDARGKRAIFLVDEEASKYIINFIKELQKKGIRVIDLRGKNLESELRKHYLVTS